MSDGAKLRLTNTLTRTKEDFVPLDAANVRMYVCGPTVYDFAHIGNARPVIVFDVLFRLLRHLYGADHVTYVRNITDVDDKINARALRDFGEDIAAGRLTLNDAIRRVTEKTANQFHADVKALGCLEPTVEPRATENIGQMIVMIQHLLDRGHAYVAMGEDGREALFDIKSMPAYGRLAGRNLEEQQAGARVSVEAHKRNPGDFVLWKESAADEPGWEAQFLLTDENQRKLKLNDSRLTIYGRPGWHIECSAMSNRYLWDEIQEKLSPAARASQHQFDIHGGGLDLIFPHHENEIAQSCCAHGSDRMARYWLHNGFLQVEGRKMSKSDGNFVTIHDLLETDRFGGRKWPGEVLRLAMLMTHYREPIDFSVRRLEEAHQDWVSFGRVVREHLGAPDIDADVVAFLKDDIATSEVITRLRVLRAEAEHDQRAGRLLTGSLKLLGFFENAFPLRMQVQIDLPAAGLTADRFLSANTHLSGDVFVASLATHVKQRYDDAGQLVVQLDVLPKGLTMLDFRRLQQHGLTPSELIAVRDRRLALIREKNWAEADRIRDELLAQGIQLKDGKDPATGERITTWEVKR